MSRFYRRAVGFEIRIDTRRDDDVLVAAENRAFAALTRERLRNWMALDHFCEEPLPAHALELLESRDLVYYTDHAAPQTTTGAPLARRSGPVALRGNIKVTPLISDATGVLRPLPFMPRRGSLTGAVLAGLQFHSLEMDTHAYAVTFTGDIAGLRALLPRLTGSETWASLSEHEALLTWLDDCALLTEIVPNKMSSARDGTLGRVTWLGHASVLALLGTSAVLIDPIFAPTPEPRRGVAMPDWRTLPELSAIAITHGDHDHLHPSSLLFLSPETTVVIPDTPEPQSYQVDAEALLALLGFTTLVRMRPWATFALLEVTLTATPFCGEDWGLALAQTTYVVSGPNGTIYCAADSRADVAALERIAQTYSVDLAFLGVTGCAEPLGASARYGYGAFYREFVDAKRRNEWVEHTAGPDESARAAVTLKAKAAFGYAAGGGAFTKLSFSDRGTHAQLAAALAGTAVAARELSLGVPVGLGN